MKNETRHYEIQLKSVLNDDWISSWDAGDNKFKSFVEACQRAREVQEKNGFEYRVVENVVTSTEMKHFPKKD